MNLDLNLNLNSRPDADDQHPLRPFLKNWLWEHGKIGTRYLDCGNGELKFDAGKKAAFAAGQPVYISLARDDAASAQSEPAHQEAALAKFLRAVQSGKPAEAGSPAEVQRVVQECVEIGLRCAYQADALAARARYSQEPMFDDEIRDAVFADIRKQYLPQRLQMALYDFVVFYGLPSALMICESPLLDWRGLAKSPKPFITMPLAPYAILVGAPSAKTSRAAPVVWTQATAMGPFKEHNLLMVDQARHWLVATTDAELEAVQAKFSPGSR
jgi:hypothetical protein